MQIVVGSRKSYKIEATISACARVFADLDKDICVLGVKVESGISSQPMSYEECIQGARNRATAALTNAPETCDLGIGIENGLASIENQWFATTWIVALDTIGVEGIASTLLRPVPADLMELVHQGYELSDAIKHHHGDLDHIGAHGLIGLITRGILQKQNVLCDGIITAISPLSRYRLYGQH